MNIHQSENLLVSVLVQIIIIILVARLAGAAARKLGQPRAVGEIVAGLLLGPSLLGYLAPDLSAAVFSKDVNVPMQIMSQLGLILLMFQIGCDFRYEYLAENKHRKAVGLIGLASIIAPLVFGFALAWISQPLVATQNDRLIFSLFVSIAFAITAVPILGRILKEYGLTKHELGVVAISAAAANDVAGWILLAAVSAYASTGLTGFAILTQVGGLLAFAFALKNIATPVADLALQKFKIGNSQLNPTLMAIVLIFIFVCGIATQKLGIFTIFGGFAAGLVFHKHHDFVEAWQKQVGQFVLVFFLPIFFTYTGLRTNVLGLTTVNDWLWCGAFISAATLAKIIPVYCASRASGFDKPQSQILSVLMNTRALMELIVLNVGYNLGFLPQNVFTMLVLMAIFTTVLTGPLLKIYLPQIGHKPDRIFDA
jgi:Kef-type K+ transport system membrane component KefB